jgi:ribosomal protein L31E
METLFALREEYEKELIKAEAKVAVINDLIARNTPTEEVDCSDEINENLNY